MVAELSPTRYPRVVVAMSGGVDSSVAAALLVDQGFDVVGIMMRLWTEPDQEGSARHNRCCTPDQMADARRVAAMLDIPFYVIDIKNYFRKTVVQFFIDEHAAGRTPNPCIVCNKEIRFKYLLERALALKADYLATGHYARVRHSGSEFQLLKAVDHVKDQSYVLHVLGQKELQHVLFPIGEYTKSEVRDLAVRYGLPVAQKSESMDLCFLGDGDYRRFLRDHAPHLNRPGPIVNSAGMQLGQHDGLSNFTTGQRKGIGVSAGAPLYVLEKDNAQNILIVGPREELGRFSLIAHEVNWISGHPPKITTAVQVKIRSRARAVNAQVSPVDATTVTVQFTDPVYGITAGQGAVFFDGEHCLGGGIIADEEV